MSKNLAELYSYVEMLLIRANSEQCDPPLAEAERLLGTLEEAWKICAQAAAPVSYPQHNASITYAS